MHALRSNANRLARADAQGRCGEEDFAQEEEEAGKKRQDGGHEDKRHGRTQVETKKSTQKQGDDHPAQEKRAGRAQGDRRTHELGTAGEGYELGINRGRVRGSRLGKTAFERAGAIDDPAQSPHEHIEQRGQAGEQEDGRYRELDDVRDSRDFPDRGEHRGLRYKKKKAGVFTPAFSLYPGGNLLSHGLSPAVPSAQEGLTSLFGMGRGVAPPP